MAGPLVKLTAIPVVAFIVAWVWLERGPSHAIPTAIASAAYLPVQWMRGYVWGGTVELNAAKVASHDSASQFAIGFVRSTYTFVKTAFWLGEWSFFKPPFWLLALMFALAIAVVASLRFRGGNWLPHAIGAAVAAIATAAFFISHRHFWGQWGGVGGWYAWGWFPWLAEGAWECFSLRNERMLTIAASVLVVIANAAWLAAAHAVYS